MAKKPEASSEATRRTCRICGRRLSQYNKTGKCFHHKPEEEILPEPKPDESPNPKPLAKTSEGLGLPDSETLISLVAQSCGVTVEEIRGKLSPERVVRARHLCAYILYEKFHFNMLQIVEKLGMTNPHYGIDRIRKKLVEQKNKDLKLQIQSIYAQYKKESASSGT